MTSKTQLQKDFAALLAAGTAASTKRAYNRDMKYFDAGHIQVFNRKPKYPVSVNAIIRFILDHNRKKKTADGTN